ncbi:NAD(P)H-dependent glycerol-3-phosphate dehydrogenase [Afifella pfennigii]|uniref:NAD(P)H-dependent glycerol-3-phosphate dehydrogenase n=1 Tax=Afifella pfennigii TaxID=209897 RepID=UPI00047C1733|nr:NAD(P)H-dependent glycerol-3-phosphate dehydrogenase [Afifella pfennigii]
MTASARGKVAVAGAGAFGTALALVAHRAGAEVILWNIDADIAAKIAASRENSFFLPGPKLPAEIDVTGETARIGEAGYVLLAAPAQATRSLLTTIGPHVAADAVLVACAKGIERESGALQSEIVAAAAPGHAVAALSGPGYAGEIARGLPTAVTVAAAKMALAEEVAARLSSASFRGYASDDPVGAELGGALKNVIAIAAGIVEGKRLGESARAALVTRGLAEMRRLGAKMGARAETFMGLSGLGDLMLTAMSRQSRNTSFGIALAEGASVAELTAPDKPLAEGAFTAEIAAALAKRHGVEMPITAAVAAVLAGRLTVEEAIAALVSRPLKHETA